MLGEETPFYPTVKSVLLNERLRRRARNYVIALPHNDCESSTSRVNTDTLNGCNNLDCNMCFSIIYIYELPYIKLL